MRADVRVGVVGILIGACLATTAFGQTTKHVFVNNTPIVISGNPDTGQAAIYPSTLEVSGVAGTPYHVSVTVTSTNRFSADVNILLVSPSGQRAVMLTGTLAGSANMSSTRLVFDDCAPRSLHRSPFTAGRYRPTNWRAQDIPFPFPAPFAPYDNTLSDFNDRTGNTNGTWSLFVMDADTESTGGEIQSWSLTIYEEPTEEIAVGYNPITCSAPDYDGDGRTDIAVYRPATGSWFIQQSGSSGAAIEVSWGAPAGLGTDDIAVPADYDADGITDMAVYRRTTGDWWVRRSFDGAISQLNFGAPSGAALGDTPVPGDYDGDGAADLAIYRETTGTWFVRSSKTGTYIGRQWGDPTSGDYPAR